MALLAADIGNTSTTFGLFTGEGSLLYRFDLPTRTLTHRALTRESLEANLVAGHPADAGGDHVPAPPPLRPMIVAVASVVPWATDELQAVLAELFPEARLLPVTNSTLPMVIDYPEPAELGSDRIIGAFAAYKQFGEPAGRPCIVIDMGTATTYDGISSRGVFCGGAIAPGLVIAAEALTERAAQLPPVELSFPSGVVGRTTVESIQSGVLYGGLSQLEGMVKRLAEARFPGEKPIVVATGGLASLFAGRTEVIGHFAPQLLLEGIRLAALAMLAAEAASE